MNGTNRISKADSNSGDEKVFRLTAIEPEFVSLVRAGANRQKQFQVIKAEEMYVCPECGHKMAAASDAAATVACPKCDGTMKLTQVDESKGGDATGKESESAEAANDNETTGPANGQEGTGKTGGEEDDGSEADGGSTEGSGNDLSSWLDEAGAEVETLSLDHAIQRALDGQSDSDAGDPKPTATKAQQIEDAGAPPVVAEEEAEEDGGESERRIAELEAELAKTQGELRKARHELTKARAKAARLAKGVGQSSVMLTGEVTTKGDQPGTGDESPTKGAFRSGGDIAAAVSG